MRGSGVSTRGLGRTNVLKNCLACALANPASKRGMSRWLGEESAADAAGENLPDARRTGRKEWADEVDRARVCRLNTSGADALRRNDAVLRELHGGRQFEEASATAKTTRSARRRWYWRLRSHRSDTRCGTRYFRGTHFRGEETLLPVLGKCMKECAPEETVVVADRAMFARDQP